MPEILPPTNDALSFPVKRANCQAAVWQQCHLQHPQSPPPETMGQCLCISSGLFLQVLMHVLTSSSMLAQNNVQELVSNAECLVYHAQ